MVRFLLACELAKVLMNHEIFIDNMTTKFMLLYFAVWSMGILS